MFSSFLYAAREKPEYREVIELLRPKISRSSFREFSRDLRLYRRFCNAYNLVPIPAAPGTALRYINALRKHYAPTSIASMLTPVCRLHRECGYPSPRRDRLVSVTLKAMQKGRKKKKKHARPMTLVTFQKFMGLLPTTTPLQLRTRAVCATAFWGMLSSTEVGRLDLDQCERFPDVWIFRLSGDRQRTIEIERNPNRLYCPIAALEAYMKAFRVEDGALWRCCTVRGRARTAVAAHTTLRHDFVTCEPMQHAEFRGYSFDSLKNGAFEEAYHAGVAYSKLQEHSGFSDHEQLLRRLRQITTFRVGDRPLPPGGQRARTRSRPGRKSFWWRSEPSVT